MKTKEFNQIVSNRIKEIREVLSHKAKEYAREDRLHNFKQAGKIANMTPELALKGFLMKHLVSIFDMIDEVEIVEHPRSQWNEKIGDSINYLILLEALIVDRNNERIKIGMIMVEEKNDA